MLIDGLTFYELEQQLTRRMNMKQYVPQHTFIDTLVQDDYASFSYEGAKALFSHLEELEESIGHEIEFDSVALRCAYSEYENIEECLKEYDHINTIKELEECTEVIKVLNFNENDTKRIIINTEF